MEYTSGSLTLLLSLRLSISALSVNLPHPNSFSLSPSLPPCKSHPRVAIFVGRVGSWSIVAPPDVKRRKCRVASSDSGCLSFVLIGPASQEEVLHALHSL